MGKIKPIHYKILTKIFESYGCRFTHTKGDHMIYHYPGAIRPIVIPKYKEIPVFIIKNNMKIVNMTNEEYSKLYNKNK